MVNQRTFVLSAVGILTAAAGTWLVEGLYYYFTKYSYSMIADGQSAFRIPYEFFYLMLFSWALLFQWPVSRPRILLASLLALFGSLVPVTAIIVSAYAHSTRSLSQIWERVQGAYGSLVVAQLIGLTLVNLLFWLVKKPASQPLLQEATK